MSSVRQLVARQPPADVVVIPPEMLSLPRPVVVEDPVMSRLAFMDARVRDAYRLQDLGFSEPRVTETAWRHARPQPSDPARDGVQMRLLAEHELAVMVRTCCIIEYFDALTNEDHWAIGVL